MMSHKPLNYMPHIDGLRGIAVLAILLFHLDITMFGGGFVGVDIFFVISGYLITSIIVKDMQAGEFSFAEFYARRVRRIFPALFVMLATTSVAAIFFLGKHDFYEFFRSVRFAAGQASNFLFGQEVDYFAIQNDHPPLLHTWSLGVEEQFYLVWPLLLLAIHKTIGLSRSLVVLSLLLVSSLAVSEYLVQTDARQAFYHLHARAWELAMGGIIALSVLPSLASRKWANAVSLTGLLLIALSVLFADEGKFPGMQALSSCLGAAMVIYAGQRDHAIGHSILSFRPLVLVGLISYSLYLWHWPVIVFYKSYFGQDLSWMEQTSLAAVSFVLAVLSYRFVEKPTRKLSWAPKTMLLAGGFLIVVFIVGSNILKNANDAPWRVTGDVAEDVRWPHPLDKTCGDDGGAENKEECIIGPNKDRYEVILAGDSHASHYAPMVLAWAKEKGLTVRLYLRGACKAWLESKDNTAVCAALNEGFRQTMEQDKGHIRYVFLGGYMADASQDSRASLEQVKSYGRKVFFLGQAPVFKNDPHECRIKNSLLISHWFPRDSAEQCMTLDRDYSESVIAGNRKELKAFLKREGIRYFDPAPFMASGFSREGQFMYRDTNHLNVYGNDFLLPHFRDFVRD